MKILSLIQGDIHPATADKVIPASDLSKLITADEVIQSAHKDAEQYQEQVRQECEEIKKVAHQEGFDSGLETFNKHLIHFNTQIALLRKDLQAKILPLALKAAKKIVADQLTLKPDTIVDIVMQALSPVVQDRHVTLFVSKTDKELLDAQKEKIKNILEHVQSLSIQERSDLLPGDCIIETDKGIINATLDNQWRALEAAFAKYMQPVKE